MGVADAAAIVAIVDADADVAAAEAATASLSSRFRSLRARFAAFFCLMRELVKGIVIGRFGEWGGVGRFNTNHELSVVTLLLL